MKEVKPDGQSPNVVFTEALAQGAPGELAGRGRGAPDRRRLPAGLRGEGKDEALEFAAGDYGLLESAYDYAKDAKPPKVTMTGPKQSSGPVDTTFEFGEEPAVIRYTTDGSEPDASSPAWDSTGPREPGEVFHVTRDDDVPVERDRHQGQRLVRRPEVHDQRRHVAAGRRP